MSLYRAFILAALTSPSLTALHYPTVQISQLEHLLVDTDGDYRSGFKDAITPCTNYVSGSQNLGRETAAQWMRVAFHDFVTARSIEGSGGVDASIGFETEREENSGAAFNDSFRYWSSFVNSKVSMADLVALGTVTSVGNCGGPKVLYRGGRIDAAGSGPSGVPAPDTDLDTTLKFFANAGFNQVDSIKLTACGHTLGSVHHEGFPTVMDNSTTSPNNTAGAGHLDITNAGFDADVVHEYLNGTREKGGPLVTSFNESSRSDLRLYNSDGNSTMQSLAHSGAIGFSSTCAELLGRMIDTVPKSVQSQMTDVIDPIQVKPVNVSFDIDQSGAFRLYGSIRFLVTKSTSVPPSTATITAGIATQTASASSANGSGIYGASSYFPFSLSFPRNEALPSTLTTLFSNAVVHDFTLQPKAFFIPSMSSATPSGDSSSSVSITAAVYNGNSSWSSVARIAYPVTQQGTLAPKMVTKNVSLKSSGGPAPYNMFVGTTALPTTALSQVSVDVVASDGSQEFLDEFNLFL
ncbi:MAG: hypothetical protein M1820_004844 [Bogoriella megaspora]|nr:MAG: hypothetical protein M1820_004844 [Bogoriella megaspora]